MSQKKATIVNLAASNVSVSQFSVEAGSLVLEQFFVEEIAPGLTGDDAVQAAFEENVAAGH